MDLRLLSRLETTWNRELVFEHSSRTESKEAHFGAPLSRILGVRVSLGVARKNSHPQLEPAPEIWSLIERGAQILILHLLLILILSLILFAMLAILLEAP